MHGRVELTRSVEELFTAPGLIVLNSKGQSMWRNFIACSGAFVSLALASPAYSQAVPTSVGTRATAGTYDFDVSNGSGMRSSPRTRLAMRRRSRAWSTARIRSPVFRAMRARTTICTSRERGSRSGDYRSRPPPSAISTSTIRVKATTAFSAVTPTSTVMPMASPQRPKSRRSRNPPPG
jgi:hypothetical protein